MNNQQFRRLILETSRQQDGRRTESSPARAASAVLGARKNASIPMTPRQVGRTSVQADFARQLAERNTKANPHKKKFKSSAPKGTKLATGYTDRTKEREDVQEDETAQRIKNLEDAMRAGQIDRETFEKLVQEITAGELSSTHLVKGLDRKLLERIRKGEDVFSGKAKEEENLSDVEDEFDELAEQDVGPIERDKVDKKGEMAPPPPVAGVKRNRNDILAELKRQREEAAVAAALEHEKKYPSLGAGFRKVNAQGETSRIETDVNGREVLIVTDAQGKEKRKVRKQKIEESALEIRRDLDDEKKPINMHNLPAEKQDESEDEDIFEGVGSNYNPLANLDDEHESSSEEEGEKGQEDGSESQREPPTSQLKEQITSSELPDASPAASSVSAQAASGVAAKHDYFKGTARTFAPKNNAPSDSSTADATVRAALQKVRTLDANSTLIHDPDSKDARLQKRAAELAARDRDMEDMDMGFGGSRFDDAEEMEREGEKVKFSEWKGLGAQDDGEDEDGGRSGGKKRKRGPKKKKGDKNSPNDVLKVMERQREKTLS